MKNYILFLAVLFLLSISIYAQEVETDKENRPIKQKIDKVQAPEAVTDEINFKNETGNPIISITDEGSNKGSITLPEMTSSPSTTLNKLYNLSGDLMFGDSTLGGAKKIDNLSDAKHDGFSLFLGEGAGLNDDAGASDGIENRNTAIGRNALHLNTTGGSNTANGYQSLYSNITGYFNTAIGVSALYGNTTGYMNTAIGISALFFNKTGNHGVAVGYSSQLYAKNTTTAYTNYNTSVGFESLRGSTSPFYNTGNYNSAFGYQSLYNNSSGSNNTANGHDALLRNKTGNNNTAVGQGALRKISSGSGNVAIGYNAGSNHSGSNKLFIENSSSNYPLIGGDFAADEIYLNGKVGIGIPTSTHELLVFSDSFSEIALFENKTAVDPDGIIIRAGPDVNPTNNVDYLMFQDGDGDNIGTIDGNGSGGVNYNTTSDARLKTNIEEYENAIEIVSQIGIKEYERLSNPGFKEIGVLAQELKKVYPQAVSGSPDSDVNTDPMMVDYSKLTPILVKAMQEQQEMISNQGEIIEELRNEIDDLKRR